MKSALFTIITLSLSAFALLPTSYAENSQKIRVGAYDNSPKIYLENGQAKGFWVDLTNYIAEQENWEIDYVECVWQECLEKLENKEIDLMVDVSTTDIREEKFTFTEETIINSWTEIYTKKDANIETLLDLNNKSLAVLKDSANYISPGGIKDILDGFEIYVNYQEFETYDEAFLATQKGQTDAVVTNMIFGWANGENYKLETSNIQFRPSKISYALPKEGPLTSTLVERIDFHIEALKENKNSIYYELYDSYFFPVDSLEKKLNFPYKVIGGGIISTLLIVLFFSYWNKELNKQIKLKTHTLRSTLRDLKKAQKVAHIGSWHLDIINDVLTWSDETYRIFGLKPQEFGATYKAFLDSIHPDDIEKVNKAYTDSLKTKEPYEIEHRIILKNGEIRHVIERCDTSFDKNDKPLHSVGTIQDITEMKQAETELRESEERLELALETAGTGMSDWNILSEEVIFNDRFNEIYGLKKHTKLQSREHWLSFIHPADRERVNKEVTEAVNGKTPYESAYRIITASNETKWVQSFGKVLFNSHDKPLRMIVAIYDITKQKDSEQELIEMDQLKSRFITALTHVARTPLSEIRWALETMLSGDFGELSKEQEIFLRKTLHSEQIILKLISNMNLALDVELGTIRYEKSKTSLLSLLKSVIKDHETELKIKNINCQFIPPKTTIPTLNLCADKIRAVLEILISNAITYSPEDKIIKINLTRKEHSTIIHVIDQGIGIPREEQVHIFERFFRASNASTTHQNGMGLELYIAKAIVEAHNGRIGFTSEEGKGSTFWIEFFDE